MLVLRRVLGMLVIASAIACNGLAVPAHAAQHAPVPLAVRLAHGSWQSELVLDPFAPTRVWKPGDLPRRFSFWVRNRAPKAADLDLQLARNSVNTVQGLLSIKVKIGGGGWQDLPITLPAQVLELTGVPADHEVLVTMVATLNTGPSDIVADPRDLTFAISVIRSSAMSDTGSATAATGSNLFLAPIFLGVALLLLTAIRVRRRLDRAGASAEPDSDADADVEDGADLRDNLDELDRSDA